MSIDHIDSIVFVPINTTDMIFPNKTLNEKQTVIFLDAWNGAKNPESDPNLNEHCQYDVYFKAGGMVSYLVSGKYIKEYGNADCWCESNEKYLSDHIRGAE